MLSIPPFNHHVPLAKWVFGTCCLLYCSAHNTLWKTSNQKTRTQAHKRSPRLMIFELLRHHTDPHHHHLYGNRSGLSPPWQSQELNSLLFVVLRCTFINILFFTSHCSHLKQVDDRKTNPKVGCNRRQTEIDYFFSVLFLVLLKKTAFLMERC